MVQDSLIEKAVVHLIGEKTGFEEAEVYWSLLKKKDLEDLNKNKKYRLLQSLFKSGFLLKIKSEGLFEYVPIPPTFLYFGYDLDEKIIKKQEEIYLKNHSFFINKEDIFFETYGDLLDGLILFLITYLMKDKAYIMLGGSVLYDIIAEKAPEKFKQIEFIGINKYFLNRPPRVKKLNLFLKPQEIIADRRLCLIDNKLLVSFYKTLDNIYIGYITSNKEKIKEKSDEFNALKNSLL